MGSFCIFNKFLNIKWWLAFTLTVLLCNGCEHNPSLVAPSCKVTGATYTNYVKFIIANNCLGCHTTGSTSPPQDTYNQLIVIVNDGRLKNVLTGSQGYPLMPFQSDPLPSCVIENIISWIDAGAPQ